MEYTQSGQPNNTSWSSPAERKRQLSKHKDTATESESRNTTSVPEKSVIQEATIWQRPETSLPPKLRVEAPVSAVPTTHAQDIRPPSPTPKPREVVEEDSPDALRQAVRNAYAEQTAVPPANEVRSGNPEVSSSAAGDSAWVDTHTSAPNYDSNPDMPPMPRRPYFWTEPEVRQPKQTQIEHDVLPPVLPIMNTKEQAEETFNVEMPTVDPAFAEAVNPNLGREPVAPSAAEVTPVTPLEKPVEGTEQERFTNDTASFTRRTPALGVESPSMQYATAERAPMPLSTTNEPMPEGSLEYPVPFKNTKEHAFAGVPEGVEPEPDATELQEHAHRIETELSRTIFIDGTSIYDMYIAKQIDADGLHRIITEYMQGGDFRNVALQEAARQQIRFERDPQMRHVPIPASTLPPEAAAAPQQPPAATTTPIPSSLARERAERLVELTQGASDKVQGLVNSPNLGTIGSIIAIVAIYTAIIIIILAK